MDSSANVGVIVRDLAVVVVVVEKTNNKRSRGTHMTHVTTAQERRVRENDKTRKQMREKIRPNHTNQNMKPNHTMRERKSEQSTPQFH